MLTFTPLALGASAPDAYSAVDTSVSGETQDVLTATKPTDQTTSAVEETVLSSAATDSDAAASTGAKAQSVSEKLRDFSFSKMLADTKSALKGLSFLPWYTYYTTGRAVDENGAEHIDKGWDAIYAELRNSGTSFGEFCAQYSAVMTNWAYTMGAIMAIIVLLIKGNKKWYWYMFFIIVAVMSVTSVGMHTADYGEFARYTMTTKLLASFVDMSFTELMAWSGVLCFTFELFQDRPKLKKKIVVGTTVWAAIVLAVLSFEVFVLNNRFLWIGGRGPDGLPFDMGGDHGGLSLAEFGCFITCLPLLYVLAASIKRMTKKERNLGILVLGSFLIAFIITSLWGDNEINSVALGNLQGHSLWHLLTAIGTIAAAFFVDERTTAQESREKLAAANEKIEELEKQLDKVTVS